MASHTDENSVKMQNIPDNVREEVARLVPSSILDDIACFTFYDDHPVQKKFCDIIICTKHGEVKEYFMRELVSSLLLRSNFNAVDIKILRSSKCELYYLVASDHEVVILSRKDAMKIHHRVANVHSYCVEDHRYNGQACLKVLQNDDAVPLIFDDTFQRSSDQAVLLTGLHIDDSTPVLIELKRKLTQMCYSTASNLMIQNKLHQMRRLSTFSSYQKMHPSLEDSMFHQNYRQKYDALKVHSKSPYVKICNQKFVIVLNVINKHNVILEDVTVLLHPKNKHPIVYTTRLYQRTLSSPFWVETVQGIPSDRETAIAVVINMSELQFNTPSTVEFKGVISYKIENKECMIPFDYVTIPFSDCMGSKMDVLANEIDVKGVLALMASSEKADLSLRVIRTDGAMTRLSLPHLFWEHMDLEHVKNAVNIVVHKKSAHHILNGVMVVFWKDDNDKQATSMTVYARSPGQIVSLINYIYDAIPFRIVVTSKTHIISAASENLIRYKEEIPKNPLLNNCSLGYGLSVLRQARVLLHYLDNCMIKMNSSTSIATQSKIGEQVDLLVHGLAAFNEFRTAMLNEAMLGVLALKHTRLGVNELTEMFKEDK